jgi:Lrp/AsnC family leucine-responsive transcriptional regulator
VSGNFDYLIKARVADMAAYREFLGETLLTLPGVQESTSYVVMEQVKETLALEVPY